MLINSSRRCLRHPKLFYSLSRTPLLHARYCATTSPATPSTPTSPPERSLTTSPSTSISSSSSSRSHVVRSFAPTRWTDTPELPYLNNNILDSLDNYVHTSPIRQVLFVWGPKSSGKTGALITKGKEWEEKGHPVIQVDLKRFDGTLTTFYNVLNQATLNALNRQRYNLPEELIRKALKRQREKKILEGESESALADTVKNAPLHLKAYVNNILPTRSKEGVRGEEEDDKDEPYFSMMKQYIKERLKGGDFMNVLEFIEEIGRLQNNPKKSPIFILREMDPLEALTKDGRSVFHDLMNYFETYKQGEHRVPIVIEATGRSKSNWQHALSSFESFKFLFVGPWRRLDAELSLVKSVLPGQHAPIFTPEEFEQVWEFSGGHAGTIYQLHANLRGGDTLGQAQDAIVQRTEQTLREFMSSVSGAKRMRRVAYLRRLRSNGYKLSITHEPETASQFLGNNLLYFDGQHVVPRNRVVQGAIEKSFPASKARKEDEKAKKEK